MLHFPTGDDEWLESDNIDNMEQYDSKFYEKFEKIADSLSEETEPSSQLTLLIELCGVLPFCSEHSIYQSLDFLCPLLVEFAKNKSNPDIMLFSLRAITFVCDLYPPSAELFAGENIVPTLCQRLYAIEYLDVAEQVIVACLLLS